MADKKDATFRGKSIEELKSLDVREFAKFLKSRQRRFVLRQFHEIDKFLNVARKKISKNKPIKTHIRDLVIVPEMIGMKIQVYNGKTYTLIEVNKDMLGHKFGEFSMTRNKVKHGKAGIGATKGSKSQSKK